MEKKHMKTVRIDDEDYKKVLAISEKKDWKDAQTLNRVIQCGLKYWDVRNTRRLGKEAEK